MSEAEFVPASQLYHVGSRTPIAHPAEQATDEQVQQALEEREIRADGGTSLSGTYYWDHKPCPLDNCDGELQQQDRFNVLCLRCEAVFGHLKDERNHILTDENAATVHTTPRTQSTDTDRADGGSR